MLPLLPAPYLQEAESLLQLPACVAAFLLGLCAGLMTDQVSLSQQGLHMNGDRACSTPTSWRDLPTPKALQVCNASEFWVKSRSALQHSLTILRHCICCSAQADQGCVCIAAGSCE